MSIYSIIIIILMKKMLMMTMMMMMMMMMINIYWNLPPQLQAFSPQLHSPVTQSQVSVIFTLICT